MTARNLLGWVFVSFVVGLCACNNSTPDAAELFGAVKRNDSQRIESLLNFGVLPNVKDAEGLTPLTWAIDRHNEHTVKQLIAHGADVNLPAAADNIHPLQLAVTEGQPKIVRILIENGASVNWVARDGGPSLLMELAAGSGNGETIEILLGSSANVCSAGHRAADVLRIAILNGNPRVVERLLRAGCDPDQKSLNGRTARDAARYSKSAEICKLLQNKPPNT